MHRLHPPRHPSWLYGTNAPSPQRLWWFHGRHNRRQPRRVAPFQWNVRVPDWICPNFNEFRMCSIYWSCESALRNWRRAWPHRAPQKLRRRRRWRTFGGDRPAAAPRVVVGGGGVLASPSVFPSADAQCAKYFAGGGAALHRDRPIWIKVCLFGGEDHLQEATPLDDLRQGKGRISRRFALRRTTRPPSRLAQS